MMDGKLIANVSSFSKNTDIVSQQNLPDPNTNLTWPVFKRNLTQTDHSQSEFRELKPSPPDPNLIETGPNQTQNSPESNSIQSELG